MSTAIATTLSTKGQLILPKAIRDRRKWTAGTRLSIEDTPDGVLVKAIPARAPATMDEIIGCVNYKGPPKTLEEMEEGIVSEVRRQWLAGTSHEGD